MSWFRGVRASMIVGLWIALATLCLLPSTPASAALEPNEAQFVFVIDDSGSMSRSASPQDSPDPDRLAVFAVRALLGMLRERDAMSVIRLNGPSEGERQPDLEPLDPDHRERMKEALELDGTLSSYSGQDTPCRTALEEAFKLLNDKDGPGISQVVIFLTDGSCEPTGEERVLDLLAGLESHRQNRFQFHLLEFEGAGVSPDLRQMALDTGGSARPLRGGDPTRILNTFALALSGSQGYESQILGPSNHFLPAHRGARSVSLLAVAPGDSPELEISVSPQGGGRPVAVETLDRAQHHFAPDGRKYRFTSARYRPTGEPMTVSVAGAGENWELVALPEYRLASELQIIQGPCSEEGHPATDVIGVHSDLCAVINLVNERGERVGPDITAGRLQGQITTTTGEDPPKKIQEDPASTDEAHFRLDLPVLAEGVHTIQAEVLIVAPDGSSQPPIPAGRRTIQVIDRRIQAHPVNVEFGDVFPGNTHTESLALNGNFPDTQVRLRLREAETLPDCIAPRFADRPLGEAVTLRPGQASLLQLVVAEDCGAKGVYPVETQLDFEMETLQEVGRITVPLSFRLDTTVRQAETLRFDLDAGSASEGTVEPPAPAPGIAPSPGTIHYIATLEPLGRQGEQAEHLRLGFLNEQSDIRMLLDTDGEVVRRQQVAISPQKPLKLRVEALRCCDTGVYRGQLRLVPVDGGAPVVAPVEVSATGNWWTCYRPWVLGGLFGLLAGLLAYYLVSMFTHVQWVSREQLAKRLVPLYWPAYGGKPLASSDRAGDREVVMEIVKAGLTRRQRIHAWWRANPFVFGLPWQKYRETVELNLAPRLELSSMDFKGERDLVGRLQTEAEVDPEEAGALFVRAGRAGSGLHFFAVRGPLGRVGDLTPEGWYGQRDGYSIEQLQSRERLIHKTATSERREGHIGGWELG